MNIATEKYFSSQPFLYFVLMHSLLLLHPMKQWGSVWILDSSVS